MRTRTVFGALGAALFIGASPHGYAQATTRRVSVSSSGEQANGHSYQPAISANSRYVVFLSDATNLVSGDANGYTDVFIRDTVMGKTTCVSVNPAGTPGNWYALSPCISADGRYVAFGSIASDLVPGDTGNLTDIFVRDMTRGTTTRVNMSTAGAQGNRDSHQCSISGDGRYVAFDSYATNLVPEDTNDRGDVFLRDTVLMKTSRISMASDGAQANGTSTSPSISADGRYVAFLSMAPNLAADDGNGDYDVFLRDIPLGTTTLVSRAFTGKAGNGGCFSAHISADGRYVAFDSIASDLVTGDTNGHTDIYQWDRLSGVITRLSVAPGGAQANGSSGLPCLSADGRFVAFWSEATNLVTDDTDGVTDLFVRDTVRGTTALVCRVSDDPPPDMIGSTSSLSADGQYVAFSASSSSLVPGDDNSSMDVFLHGPLVQVPFTVQDVRLALRIAAGLVSATHENVLILDQTGDTGTGRLDVRDAIRIVRKVAGLDANP